MFHKVHHEFNHTIALAFTYAHPVEFAICNHYPLFAGTFLLGPKNVHFVTFFIWLQYRVSETMEGHSGYDFPLPVSILLGNMFRLIPVMGTNAAYHDFHHSKNVGNYSSFFTIWDTVFNSNADYYAYLKSEEKMAKEKKE